MLQNDSTLCSPTLRVGKYSFYTLQINEIATAFKRLPSQCEVIFGQSFYNFRDNLLTSAGMIITCKLAGALITRVSLYLVKKNKVPLHSRKIPSNNLKYEL